MSCEEKRVSTLTLDIDILGSLHEATNKIAAILSACLSQQVTPSSLTFI